MHSLARVRLLFKGHYQFLWVVIPDEARPIIRTTKLGCSVWTVWSLSLKLDLFLFLHHQLIERWMAKSLTHQWCCSIMFCFKKCTSCHINNSCKCLQSQSNVQFCCLVPSSPYIFEQNVAVVAVACGECLSRRQDVRTSVIIDGSVLQGSRGRTGLS